jgi:DNA-binding Xre family transcriptional regulator
MKLIVRQVAEREGIRNPLELSQKSGIAYASCHRLWNEEVKQIGIETIERLCTLLRVWPNQLFDYKPEPNLLPQASEPNPARHESAKPRRSSGSASKSKRESKQTRTAIAMR